MIILQQIVFHKDVNKFKCARKVQNAPSNVFFTRDSRTTWSCTDRFWTRTSCPWILFFTLDLIKIKLNSFRVSLSRSKCCWRKIWMIWWIWPVLWLQCNRCIFHLKFFVRVFLFDHRSRARIISGPCLVVISGPLTDCPTDHFDNEGSLTFVQRIN